MFSSEIALQVLHKLHQLERPKSANRIFHLLAAQGRGDFFANNYGVFFGSESGMFFKVDADWMLHNNLTAKCNLAHGQPLVTFLAGYCDNIFTASDKDSLEVAMKDWRNLNEISSEKAAEVLQRIFSTYPIAFSQTIVLDSGDRINEYSFSIFSTTCKFCSSIAQNPTGTRKEYSKRIELTYEQYVSEFLFKLAQELM